ncbi:unnamed protein product [Symbiodinium natans]|uniref:Uncharacterized protein n=1 Tax=Symbiodinium natans TaxID=878477 RepID=A0A812PBE2_9DINO|nr:unnamed protein product [Symbiodinium natans]
MRRRYEGHSQASNGFALPCTGRVKEDRSSTTTFVLTISLDAEERLQINKALRALTDSAATALIGARLGQSEATSPSPSGCGLPWATGRAVGTSKKPVRKWALMAGPRNWTALRTDREAQAGPT